MKLAPVLRCALLIASSLLAACGGNDTATPTPATEQVLEVPANGFGLVGAAGDSYEGRPAILLTFSTKLAGAQKFDDLLTVAAGEGAAPSGSWVLDANGRELRFPYLEANKTYKVTVKAELAAADGKVIGKAVTREIYTGPLQPILGFASQGSVLPAHETRGLPVVTVNVGEVDVEFLRVREGDLPKFVSAYSGGGQRSYWTLEEMSKYADSVYATRFAVESVPNERTLTYLPIRDIDELKKPGLYFAVMKRPGTFDYNLDTSLFFVSDIGLHLRTYPTKLLVHTASLETGEAKSNVALSIRDNKGDVVAQAETDDDGLATFDNYAFKSEHVLVASWGRDVSMLAFNQAALDLSEFAVAGRPQRASEIFPWASRDLYRPGETVRISALLRDHDGRAVAAQPLFATLRQPDGRAVLQQQIEPGELGYYEFTRAIAEDAPTGRWSVDFATDPKQSNSAYAFSFRVEEFLPERLKLDLNSSAERLAPGEALTLDVEAAYLYGAPAAGNRFTAKRALSVDLHPVPALKDFTFGDALVEVPTDLEDVTDDKLDDEGKLTVEVATDIDAATKSPIQVIVAGSVFETGGRAVTRSLKRTIWPAETLVGIRPLFDAADGAVPNAAAEFEVVRTDAAGQLLAGDKLKVKVVRLLRDYHWTWVNDTGWQFDYTSREETTDERELSFGADTRGKFSTPVEWGEYRLEITDPATQLTLKQPFQAGWGWDDNRGNAARPDKVKLALDKTEYREGETIKLTLTPPHEGPALLLLEGDGLLWHTNLAVRAGTEVEIPLDPSWSRHDLYLSALVFRPGSAQQRITPNRAVGIAHVKLARGERKVAVEVGSPEMMRPGNDLAVDIAVPRLAGKQAQVRISATDLGVLNITQFALPDAAAWFFAQRRLGVDAYDLYGRVIESFDGNRARLRYGGDAALAGLPQGRRPNAEVRIVDLFHAPVALDAQGKARISVPVPDFNGTLRVRALVYSADTYGAGEHDTIVRAPVVVEASTPRILAPGDSTQITLDVQNLSGADGKFSVELSADGPIVLDRAKAEVTLADNAKQTLTFPLHAREAFGTAHIDARVRGGEIDIQRRFAVAVRPAWPAIQRVLSSSVQADNASIAANESLRAGLIGDSVAQRISIGTLPPLPFGNAVQGLFQYPYGCVEQTTSKAFPLVWLNEETVDRLGIKDAHLVDPMGNKLIIDADLRTRMLETAFARLASMQGESGHFSMWPGGTDEHSLMTPYVAELLLNARDAGFAIPEAMLTRALDRINNDLLAGGITHYEYEHYEHLRLAEMAHGAYVLARVGRAPVGTLRALYDNEREKLLAPVPLLHLGVALALQGDKARGEQAIAEAFSKDFQRPEWIGDYSSPIRDWALLVALTHEHGLSKPEYDAKAFDLAREYLGTGGGGYWFSTQEQIALFRMGRALLAESPHNFGASIAIGGAREELTGRAYYSRTFTPAELAAGVRVTPNAQGSLFVSQEVAGIPRSAPSAEREDLKITRTWYTTDGALWKGDSLREGDVLVAAITVESKQTMADALVVDLLPGGLEVENLNLTDASQWENVTIDGTTVAERAGAADIKFEEYRDDRYVAAVALNEYGPARLFYLVRAVTPGRFVVPPVSVEDMYRPTLRAFGKRDRETLVVTQP
jgi:hypothetical protein